MIVYLPITAVHSPPSASGYVQYGPNTIGSLSCAAPAPTAAPRASGAPPATTSRPGVAPPLRRPDPRLRQRRHQLRHQELRTRRRHCASHSRRHIEEQEPNWRKYSRALTPGRRCIAGGTNDGISTKLTTSSICVQILSPECDALLRRDCSHGVCLAYPESVMKARHFHCQCRRRPHHTD